MKTLNKFSSVIALTLTMLLSSCHGDLDITQKGGMTPDYAWETADDAKAAMYGMFSTFRATFSNEYMYWGEYRTGLWGKGIESQAVRDDVYANTIDAGNAHTNWEDLYTTINQCNLILEYTPKLEFSHVEDRNLVMGNAHFARAFCFYWIARIWGDAPLTLKGYYSDKQENLFPFRSPVNEIYSCVEQDLKDAETELKASKAENKNIATLAAVNTLQTDFYLWMSKVVKDPTALDKARTACNAAIGKALLIDYSDVFDVANKLNDEVIFAWSMVKDEKEGGFQADWLCPIQYVTDKYIENPVKIGSHQQWAFITPEYQTLLKSVEGDVRLKATFDEFYDTEKATTHHWINKYAGTWTAGTRYFNSDIIVYRYADVLLFDAEIKNAQNLTNDAIISLNTIAKRAYGKVDYYSNLTKEQVDQTILIERKKEFCAEGKLWWDYIRFGVVFKEVPGLSGRDKSKNVLLWPINQGSLNDNQNLYQTEFDD